MRDLARAALRLLRASHPEPGFAVTAVAAVLAATAGLGAGGIALVAGAVLAGQLSIGWLNDAVDAERDARVGRADKPVALGELSRRSVLVAAVVSVLACVPLSLACGPVAGAAHLVAVGSAWSYNLWLKSTVVSVLPYALSFGLLPAFVVLSLPGQPTPPVWLVAAGALLGSAAHFANALPDLADDAATGVRGLPHTLGRAGSWLAAAGLMVATSLVLVLGPPGPPTWLGAGAMVLALAILAGGYLLGRRPGSRAPFRAMLAVALVDVLLLATAGAALRL